MLISKKLFALVIIAFAVAAASVGTSTANMQAELSLAGEWIVTSSPINEKMASPKGVSLGFPERDMIFEQQGDLRTGVVLRDRSACGESPVPSSPQRFSCGARMPMDRAAP